jgi:hypothetical protein
MKAKDTAYSTTVRIVVLGVLILLSSCTPFWEFLRRNSDPSRSSPGSSIFSHRGKLYFLGGKTSTEEYSDTVGMALLGDDGTLVSWIPQTPLPEARASHSVVAYGEFLYLIGGENESGYLDDVWYIYVSPEGRLGSRWTKSDFSLPEGRASSAAFVAEGRLYLAGGDGPDGETDEILSSKIWRDGRLGLWSPTSRKLPSARSGATALCRGSKVYIAGGKSSLSYHSDFLVSEISDDGALGDWAYGPRIPDSRAFAALVPDVDNLAILGGEGPRGMRLQAYTLGPDMIWAEKPSFAGAWSGQAAVLQGYAFLPRPISISGSNDTAEIGILPLSQKTAGMPSGKPSGGLIKKGSSIAFFSASDETIRYSLAISGEEPPDPDESSTPYDPTSRPVIESDTVLKARSFKPGYAPSEIERFSFIVEPTSLLFTIEKNIWPSPEYKFCTLQESLTGGETIPTSVVWYALVVAERGYYTLAFRDKDDDEAAYSDTVLTTLFEGDVLSLLRDSFDMNMYNRNDDAIVYLAPGSYYLRITSASGSKGGTFGLRFSRLD